MTDVAPEEGQSPSPEPDAVAPDAAAADAVVQEAPTPFAASWKSAAHADQRPVFVLAFANDRYGPTTGYLRDLVAEMRAIEKALARSPIRVVARSNVTRDDLYDALAEHNDRIVGFHYGGHATESVLMLEDDEGRPAAARIEGLATRLAMLPRLSLVVLNGCSTAEQVDVLRARCAAPIIATDQAIVDALARDFAQRFYADLAADRSIGEAFESAVSAIEASVESAEATHRSPEGAVAGPDAPEAPQTRMLRPAEHVTEGGWPWRLYADPQRPERLDWRISATIAPTRNPWPLRAAIAAAFVTAVFAVGWGLGDADDPCTATLEECNGRDDDCDGLTDETGSGAICAPLGLGRVWGEGRCADAACQMAACPAGWHDVDGRYETGCEYRCTPMGEEICNAADDDCDGISDEGFPGCDPGCDGIDDDGDGRSDEGCAVVRCGPERVGGVAVPPCNGCPDGVEVPAGWVCIPAGEVMGGSSEPSPFFTLDVIPPRPLRIERPFLAMATQVTQAGWAAVARAIGVEAEPSFNPCEHADGQCPVERVSIAEAVWFANAASTVAGLTPCYDASTLGRCRQNPFAGRCAPDQIGCAAVCDSEARIAMASPRAGCTGFRLPTGDEWAYAARSGSTGRHVAGNDATTLRRAAWYAGNAGGTTHAVGGLAPNRWGLFDMLGNTMEWVADGGYRGCSYLAYAEKCRFGLRPNAKNYVGRSASVGLRFVRDLPRAEAPPP